MADHFTHLSVMAETAPREVVTDPDGIYVDATFGRGGHSRRILQRLSSRGRLIAFDRDPQAIESAAAIEDARFVLPGACETRLVLTMNARELLHFFRLRCCNRAQWEIRALADEMLRLVCEVAPSLFVRSGPSCVAGPCPEGAMCCGQTAQVREKYAALKQQALQQ